MKNLKRDLQNDEKTALEDELILLPSIFKLNLYRWGDAVRMDRMESMNDLNLKMTSSNIDYTISGNDFLKIVVTQNVKGNVSPSALDIKMYVDKPTLNKILEKFLPVVKDMHEQFKILFELNDKLNGK